MKKVIEVVTRITIWVAVAGIVLVLLLLGLLGGRKS